jgi:hypothetical protein
LLSPGAVRDFLAHGCIAQNTGDVSNLILSKETCEHGVVSPVINAIG